MKSTIVTIGLTGVTSLATIAHVASWARRDNGGVRSAGGPRVALLGVVVAVGWPTVCSATATAAVIPGDPLRIFMDGSGQLQARFQGYEAGELRPAYLDLADKRSGMVFTIYYSSGSASLCGPSIVGGLLLR